MRQERCIKKQEPSGSCFFNCIFFAQIIRAKVPAQTKTIIEMPIKKYFTFIAPRIKRHALKTKSN